MTSDLRVVSYNVMSNVLFSDALATDKDGYQNLHALRFRESSEEFTRQLNKVQKKLPQPAYPKLLTPELKQERMQMIYRLLESIHPDILLLQEVNLDPLEVLPELRWNFQPPNMRIHPELYARGYKNKKYDGHGNIIQFDESRFEPIELLSGNFLSPDMTSGSGSPYSLVILIDKFSKNRLFILNIHVKLEDFFNPDANINFISSEINQYIGPILERLNANAEDGLILGGDFNAGFGIIKPKVYLRNFNLLEELLQNKDSVLLRFGGRLHSSNPNYATQETSMNGIMDWIVDYIFTNLRIRKSMDDELTDNVNLLATYSNAAIKKNLKELTGDRRQDFMDEMSRLSDKNTNIILRDKKPYSDHKPIGLILSTTFMSGGRRKYSTKKHTKKHTKKRTLKSNKFTKIDKTK